jgi:AraC family transcriptional regulator
MRYGQPIGTKPSRPLGARRAVVGHCRAELLPRNPYGAAYTPDTAILGFAFESQVGTHAFGGDRRTGFRASPNGLASVPIGCDVFSQSDRGGEYLTIAFAPEPGDRAGCERRFSDVIDPAAIGAARRLRRMLLTGGPVDPLQFERLVGTLKQCAVRVFTHSPTRPGAGAWMTVRRLTRIDELIEVGLEGKLTVQELAAALGLSAGFFSRAFKAAVGKAPHDYIIERRIARARMLLRSDARSRGSVAFASGFASHAHMAATFRNRLGASPGHLRSAQA